MNDKHNYFLSLDADWAKYSLLDTVCYNSYMQQLKFAGPTLCNHLMIHQSVALPGVDLTHDESDMREVDVPHSLKQRWKPFGYGKFIR
jgi:hypothetical protein